jgi:hypothetical protein
VVKTHNGVNVEFLRLTRDDPRFPPEQRGLLSKAYDFKAVADYDTWPIARGFIARGRRGYRGTTIRRYRPPCLYTAAAHSMNGQCAALPVHNSRILRREKT